MERKDFLKRSFSEQRGCTQLVDYRSFHTFNFGDYQQESRRPFGPLIILNDDTLLADKSHAITVAEATEILLLPVVGGIELVDALGESVFLGAGEIFQFTAIPGQEGVYLLSNPQKSSSVFIIQGAFEVQNRLLHARDGLALWQVEEVEFEALSNNAILLLMEL